VEECIRTLPGVADVGVVGLPHERWGATVVAAIVREAGASITAGDVVAHCRRHLAGYKKPTDVRFVDELPRTTSFKLSRGQLRDALDRGAGQRQPAV
jgi:acyl-CoA synthetase (AMP-forming)/AMP-acid ligase II